MLLESEYKQTKKNSNKALNVITLAYCNFDHQGQKTSGY